MKAVVVAVALGLVACGDNTSARVVVTSAMWTSPLADFVAFTPGDITYAVSAGPPVADTADTQVAVIDDPAMATESYVIEAVPGTKRTWLVHAHDVLGAQYGLAGALEDLGFRFRHPYDALAPELPVMTGDDVGVVHAPQVRVRGLQLHTLHPIESYFAFWEDGPNDPRAVIDWLIKNRGNFVQWCALQDIMEPTRHAQWAAFTNDIIAYAHERGVRVGINVQLFSASSLQQAFTLVQDETSPAAAQIAANLPFVVDGLAWDVYALSFGEFFDADPQAFIDSVNETASQLAVVAPNAEMHAVVHVGGTQLVTYMGQTLIYYFLVQFASPTIIPDIHTVMYFDLFETADGAYQMTDFSPHRQYLLSKMCANQPAAYFPEDAYWIAFDDSVPTYLPLYVRSRLYDLTQLRAAAPPPCGPLDEHLVFSSGWEWGYWLHDTATLRASYELPVSQAALFEQQLGPDLGSGAAEAVSDLADAEHDALITQDLAPYFASRDALIDAGRAIDVISQPDRVTFSDLVAASDAERASFQTTVMTPLAAFVATLDGLDERATKLQLPNTRWARELIDGFAIDRARAHFIYEAYTTTLAHLAGDAAATTTARASADRWLATGASIVARRHGDRHLADRDIIDANANYTVYAFGYLYMADTLCYWHRELDQVDGILGNTSVLPPSCVFPQ